jgi:hypothetical protein
MSANPPARLPARADDAELAMDRPGRRPWRDLDREEQPARPDEPERLVVAPRPRSTSPLDLVSRGIGLLLKLTLLLILLALLWGVVTLIGVGVRTPGAIGDQIGSAIQRGAGVVGAAIQRAEDTVDPAHPPREPLAQDTEIDQLLRVDVGGTIEGSSQRTLTVASIQRRADPSGPDSALYVTLHGELRQPRETKILGATIQSTRDPHDYYLYKGESLRIGRTIYKVNWVSVERQQIALVAYRDQDRISVPLKADID